MAVNGSSSTHSAARVASRRPAPPGAAARPKAGRPARPHPPARQRLREARAVAGVEEVQVLPRRQAGFNLAGWCPASTAGRNGSCRARGGVALSVHLPCRPARAAARSAGAAGCFGAAAAGDLHPLPGVHGERQPAKQRPRPARSTDPASGIIVIAVHIQVDMAYKHRSGFQKATISSISFCGRSVPTLG